MLRGYSGLSPAFAAVGALKRGGWSWEGVVLWLEGRWGGRLSGFRAVGEGRR